MAYLTDRAQIDQLAAQHDLKPETVAWVWLDPFGTLAGFTNGTSRTIVPPAIAPRSMNS